MDEKDFIQNRFGYCYYEIKDTSALIYNLYVHPLYRRQGMAKLLLKHVVNEIRERGYKGDIGVEAIPKENSIQLKTLIIFYRKIGLKTI